MKGKGLIFFAVGAILAGVITAVYLSQTTIKEKEAEITGLESDKASLEKDKASLEKDKEDLTVKLDTADTNLKLEKTKLSDLSMKYDMKVSDYDTQVAKHELYVVEAAAVLADKNEEISNLSTKLSTAQNKNRDYDSQIKTLNSQMADKDRAIDDIGRRLKSTEEDRDHLLLEQKKLIAEKAELEKQFQDILVLRQKVQQLQVELMASKKLEWLRRGFYGGARKKGGSRLMGMGKKSQSKTVSPNADLNVEVRRDGTVKIVPIQTNSPPNGVTP